MVFTELLLVLAALTSDEDEAAFARRIRAGDEHAFRQLFERYHGPLYRYLVHRNVDRAVAEDLVQQAFVMIWERRKTIREDGSIRGLLYRIALTRALNHFRDTARFTDSEPDETVGAVEAPDPAMAREVRDAITRAVAGLPERRRAVFELCVLEGLTYRETAEAMEISIKTVENQMVHALRHVRQALEDYRPRPG